MVLEFRVPAGAFDQQLWQSLRWLREHPTVNVVLVTLGTLEATVYVALRSNQRTRTLVEFVIIPLGLLGVFGLKLLIGYLLGRKTKGL